jgi:hypothetical protein
MDAPVNTIVRYKLNGGFDQVIVDYNAFPGDTPVDMVEYDSNYLLVLIENSSGRRIDKVAKDGSGFSTFISNSSALSAQLRSLTKTFDGGWLVSKGTAIEKFSSNKSRIRQGTNPYVNAPAGACATSTTLISKVIQGPGNNIVYLHAATSPNNKIGMIKPTGYSVAGDCLFATSGATANHFPTAALLHSSGKLLVAYSSSTGPVSEVYSYPITATDIGAGTSAFNNPGVLYGVTAMAELPNGHVLISSAASGFNSVDEFSYDPTTQALTRVGNAALILPNAYSRSISSLLVAE